MFLIKWKGYPMSDNSWEPIDHLNCPLLLESFINSFSSNL